MLGKPFCGAMFRVIITQNQIPCLQRCLVQYCLTGSNGFSGTPAIGHSGTSDMQNQIRIVDQRLGPELGLP